MIRTILFDFNGVLVDDEPLHFLLFQKTLAEKNIPLTKEEYYQKYLGFDDRDAFTAVLKGHGTKISGSLLQDFIQTKAKFYEEASAQKNLFVPGALDFVKQVSQKYFLGLVSGALRPEIEAWLDRGGIRSLFQVIVAAEDIQCGKPDPEGYLRALDVINRDFVSSSEIILPQECVVIEDSIWGIEAAHAAGMRSVALTTSYRKEELQAADVVVQGFSEISFDSLN